MGGQLITMNFLGPLSFCLVFGFLSSAPVPSVILTALPGPIIGGLALAGFGTSLALQGAGVALGAGGWAIGLPAQALVNSIRNNNNNNNNNRGGGNNRG